MLSKYRLPVLIEHRHCKCSGVYHDLAFLKACETMGVKSEKTLTLVDSVVQRQKKVCTKWKVHVVKGGSRKMGAKNAQY